MVTDMKSSPSSATFVKHKILTRKQRQEMLTGMERIRIYKKSLKLKKLMVLVLTSSLFSNAALAANLDEAAKCAATFKVLTSLRINNENLADHFTKQGLISLDMMGLYAEHETNRIFTNGEFSDLIDQYQTELDEQQPDGNAFVPYVRSCTGWTFKIGLILLSENDIMQKEILLLDPSNNPNLAFEYPHSTWPQMKDLFFESYKIWRILKDKY